MSNDDTKKKKRQFFYIDTNPEEKATWEMGALARGMRSVSEWFRMLARDDIKKSKKFYKSQEE